MQFHTILRALASLLIMLSAPLAHAAPASTPIPIASAHSNIKANAREIITPYGIKIWLLEDHSLPITALHFAFRKAGHAYDPKGKEGLAKMITDILDDGAGGMSGEEFKKRLEASAITLSFDEDEDNLYITVKCLTENLEEAMGLLKLALTAPAFEASSLTRTQSRLINLQSQKTEDPESYADFHWRTAYYNDSSYASSGYGTKESVSAITAEDLRKYVTGRMTRVNLIISAAGDLNPARLKSLLDNTVADLPLVTSGAADIKASPPASGSILVIDRDIPQSIAIFGQHGLKRNDPDFYALFILNYILGGGSFESRLMKAVREEKGLAYSVYSFLDLSDYSGLLRGTVATKNARIYDSLAIIKAEMTRLKTKGITEPELRDAKNYLTLSFPLKMDRSEALAQFLTSMQLNALGINFINERNNYIDKVTAADVNRVAKNVIDPDALTVVVIGNKKEMSHDK
jgi:zinc protease